MATCSRCAAVSPDGRLACSECGQPFPAPDLRFARAALILGIISYPLLLACGLGAFTAMAAVVSGSLALVQAARVRSTDGRRSAVAGIVLGGVCLGLVALLTLPNLLASRLAANEATAVGDIMTILQAEVEYSKVNDDHYDTLECLAAPARCLAGFDTGKPAFLPAELASARVRMGYTRTFHAGPRLQGARKGRSPSSIAWYAYVAVPSSPGSSGVRSFCGDFTGRMCADPQGGTPAVVDGMCAPACRDLR